MKHPFSGILFLSLLCLFFSAAEKKARPNPAPDYTTAAAWLALPDRRDAGDSLPPGCTISDNQANAAVDVFYVHPTVFFSSRDWNANLSDKNVNKKCESCVIQQGAVFNAAGRVYAPRYRQAALRAFYNEDPERIAALDFAYADVKAAFEYYLKHWNKDRPIIIAGHSQGARHTAKLLHDFFEGKPLKKQLVAAYIVGMNFSKTEFRDIPLADSASQTGCFITWNTVAWGQQPTGNFERYKNSACVNPLTWTTSPGKAPRTLNNGSVPLKFNRMDKNNCETQIHDGLLWTTMQNKKGYYRLGNSYHVSDYALFYMNIRANAVLRANKYLEMQKL